MANEQEKNLHNVDSVHELERLLNSGANINERNVFYETPLITALRREVDFEVIRCFVQLGSDVNAKDCWGVSPLYCAVARHGRNLKLIKLLLDNGADIEGGKQINDRFLDHNVTHNLLCMKLLIKYKFLRNAHLLDLSFRPSSNLNRNYYEEYKAVVALDLKPSCYRYLRKFLDSCAAEVVRMLTVYVGPSVSLHHFITDSLLAEIPRKRCEPAAKEILDGVLAEILRKKYLIYGDMITSKIGRVHLIGKICEQLHHHAPVGENFPYHIVLDNVAKYFNKEELMNIVKAFK
ncbi:hypothetical protein JTE90_013228 [Oedothorax gibbosus]|uniref:Uncharacterized protein n=1 Tax=Oedothorax gibbosus TaxID=931172 RepID=A0AAV6VCV4_9ARAC|nr:hypothetical protein JTE90_013228 [Oedothorax gibbosus]